MKSQEIGLGGYNIQEINTTSKYEIKASFDLRPQCCIQCGFDQLVSKGLYKRKVRHLESYGLKSTLHIQLRRWQCKRCHRCFVPELPGIRPGHRSTEPFRRKVYQDHQDGICASRLAQRESLGHATIGRIYSEFTYLQAQERRNQPCPQVLGIDEHTLHRGQRFVTTFCNLKNRKIFDVVQGKSQGDLLQFLCSLKDRHKVKVVCIDLCSAYRQLIRKWFPNAKIVADRFHAIRIIQYHFLSFCRAMVPAMKHRKGLIKALRKNPENLTQTDQQRLDTLFNRYPLIKDLYQRQIKLRSMLKLKTLSKDSCRRQIPELMDLLSELATCGLESMKTLSKTLTSWIEEIVRMWRFTRSNGITEGYHRKMKLIQRRAYGFRNFENYRLRVIAQCG